MVAIVHDDHILSFCLRWTAQKRREQQQEQDPAGAWEHHNSKDHFFDSYDERGGGKSERAIHRQLTARLRWYLIASKRLTNSHPECVAIHALGDIGSKIDVVLLT
jgi:hypothetical protein